MKTFRLASLAAVLLLDLLIWNPASLAAQHFASFTVDGTSIRQEVIGVGGSVICQLPGGIDSLLAASGWDDSKIPLGKEALASLIFDDLDVAVISLSFPLDYEFAHLDETGRNASPTPEGTIPDGNISFPLDEDRVLLSPLPLPHVTQLVVGDPSPETTKLGLETLNTDWTGVIQLALYYSLFSHYEFEGDSVTRYWGDNTSGTHRRITHSYETAAQHYWPFVAIARTDRFSSQAGRDWYSLPLTTALVPELSGSSSRGDGQPIAYVGIRWYPAGSEGGEIAPYVRARWLVPPGNDHRWQLRKIGHYPSYALPTEALGQDSFPSTEWDSLTGAPVNLHEDRYFQKGNVRMSWTGVRSGNDNDDPDSLNLLKFKVTGEPGELWSTDAYRWLCAEALEPGRRGNDIYFKMRVTSPASWLKTHDSKISGFVKVGNEKEFREHVSGHLKAWLRDTGIRFDGVEIQNEPENGVWYPCALYPLCPAPSPNPDGWPGGPTLYRNLALELCSGLQDLYGVGETPIIHMGSCVIPERITTFLLGGYSESPLYEDEHFEGALTGGFPCDNWLIDSHLYVKWGYQEYIGPESLVTLFRELRNMQWALNDSGYGEVPTAVSEFCISKSSQPDPDLYPDDFFKIAVYTAVRLGLCFAFEASGHGAVTSHVNQVHWWLLFGSSQDAAWGQMLIDLSRGCIRILPQYYGIKHMSHFLHGDNHRLSTSLDSTSAEIAGNFTAIAFRRGGEEPRLVIVLIGGAPIWYEGQQRAGITFNLPGLPEDLAFAVYRSIDIPGSAADEWWTFSETPDSLTANGTQLSDSVFTHSMNTYVADLPP